MFEFLRVIKRILFDENYDFYKKHLDIPRGEFVNDLTFKLHYVNQGYKYPLVINKGKRNGGILRVSEEKELCDFPIRVSKDSIQFTLSYEPTLAMRSSASTIKSLSNYDLSSSIRIRFFFYKKESVIMEFYNDSVEIDLSQDDSYLYLLHGRIFPNVIVDEASWKQLANPQKAL